MSSLLSSSSCLITACQQFIASLDIKVTTSSIRSYHLKYLIVVVVRTHEGLEVLGVGNQSQPFRVIRPQEALGCKEKEFNSFLVVVQHVLSAFLLLQRLAQFQPGFSCHVPAQGQKSTHSCRARRLADLLSLKISVSASVKAAMTFFPSSVSPHPSLPTRALGGRSPR